jgi:hypothetical protein
MLRHLGPGLEHTCTSAGTVTSVPCVPFDGTPGGQHQRGQGVGATLVQFVTGTSNGGLTAHPGGDRWRRESRMFAGAYDDAPGHQRPVYGSLNFRYKPFGGSPRLGSAHLRLTADTLTRTTFCYPDSAAEPQHFGTAACMSLIELARADTRDDLDDHIEHLARFGAPTTTNDNGPTATAGPPDAPARPRIHQIVAAGNDMPEPPHAISPEPCDQATSLGAWRAQPRPSISRP